MVHSADDLWGHVAWRPAGFLWVVVFHPPGHAEVSHPQIPIFFEDQVLRFEVSVDDALGVDILQRQNNAGHHKP